MVVDYNLLRVTLNFITVVIFPLLMMSRFEMIWVVLELTWLNTIWENIFKFIRKTLLLLHIQISWMMCGRRVKHRAEQHSTAHSGVMLWRANIKIIQLLLRADCFCHLWISIGNSLMRMSYLITKAFWFYNSFLFFVFFIFVVEILQCNSYTNIFEHWNSLLRREILYAANRLLKYNVLLIKIEV